MSGPLRIVITPEEIGEREAADISRWLDEGWDYVHLRHPEASLRDMRRLIEAIPQRHHRRLRLHGHFHLASEFNLGGLHLNGRCPAPPAFYSGALSRSCHSVAEVREAAGQCDYVTLSPIFDSISKKGYRSAFTVSMLEELNDIARPLVIALGGVTPDRLAELKRFNFAGYAVKGAIDLFKQ